METEVSLAAPTRRSTEEVVLPLALAQFIIGFAATSLNAATHNIVADTKTTVSGVQTAITLFTLIVAALLLPAARLADILGRKRCLIIGLVIYGIGALLSALALSLGTLVGGYSVLEGVGAAFILPAMYVLIVLAFPDATHRARYIGFISAAGGVGAAVGPLVGGIITTVFTWRGLFMLQVAVAVLILIMTRRLPDSPPIHQRHTFDRQGALLGAAGLLLVILSILLSRAYGWFLARQDFRLFSATVIARDGLSPVWLFGGVGVLVLVQFYRRCRRRDRAGQIPILSPRLLRNRTSNLGLATVGVQWLILQGSFFVVAVFLQVVRDFNAVETGLVLAAATIGILASFSRASLLAAKFHPPELIRVGFILGMLGLLLLMFFANLTSNVLTFLPGLLVLGLGLGIMLTASVTVVQSGLSDEDQGEISGLSRSVANLGASLGTAFVGSWLTSSLVKNSTHFMFALLLLLLFAGLGWLAAKRMPETIAAPAATAREYADSYTGPKTEPTAGS